MTEQFTMGGTAVFDFVEPINGYVVAMSGDFDGGVFARVVGEPRLLAAAWADNILVRLKAHRSSHSR